MPRDWLCSPAWDSVLAPVSRELSNLLLPQLTNCLNKLGKLQMFSSAFYPLVLQRSARIKSFTASNSSGSTAPLWGQRRFVGLETPFPPSTSSPRPSTAGEGEKDLSAHRATAPRSIPFLLLLPKGWTRPHPTCILVEKQAGGRCERCENSSVRLSRRTARERRIAVGRGTSIATHSLWVKGQDSSFSFGIAMPVSAGKLPCSPAGLCSLRIS